MPEDLLKASVFLLITTDLKRFPNFHPQINKTTAHLNVGRLKDLMNITDLNFTT